MELVHGVAFVLGRSGVLLTGPSGMGKTTLALSLIEGRQHASRFAALVADDQVQVRAEGGRLRAQAPATIVGLMEVHGLSPQPVITMPSAIIDLVCMLAGPPEVPRYQETAEIQISGVVLPSLVVAGRNVTQSSAVILHWLRYSQALRLRQNS